MSATIAIVGAGTLGRMLAVAFYRKGWHVTLFDRNGRAKRDGNSWASTGLITPYVELTKETQTLTLLGEYVTEQWPVWAESLADPVFFRENGVLAVAHPRDTLELDRLQQRIAELAAYDDLMTECAAADVASLEPELAGRFPRGLFFPLEQHLDPCSLLHALGRTIEAAEIPWHENTEVTLVSARSVTSARGTESFDWVIDARGLGAAFDMKDLRTVRSEVIRLHAPGVNLSRPVRLMHPHHALYIVPQVDHRYVVGSIESRDATRDPISVRSTLELLSAAHTVHPAFGDAALLETAVAMHPTLPNGLPRISPHQGLLSINGLSRNTWLVAPALVDIAVTFIDTGGTHPMADGIMEEWTL